MSLKLFFKIFRFINFLLYCLILPFPQRPSRGPAISVFLVISRLTVTGCCACFNQRRSWTGKGKHEHWMHLRLVFLVMTTNKIDQFHFFVRVLRRLRNNKVFFDPNEKDNGHAGEAFRCQGFRFRILAKCVFWKRYPTSLDVLLQITPSSATCLTMQKWKIKGQGCIQFTF